MEQLKRLGAGRLLVFALLLGILGFHAVAVSERLHRPPTFDEAEHLHASWLMSQGKRPYRDFAEDHTPFLPVLLRAVQPTAPTAEYPKLDVPRFLVRARVLMAVLGTAAVLAAAAFAWRVTGSDVAPVIVLACVLGSESSLSSGIVEVRNDPPTLLLFWLGVLLSSLRTTTRAGAVRVGLGLGTIGVALVWNPKWPLETAVLALFAVVSLLISRQRRLALHGLATAAAVVGAALLLILPFTSPGDFVFFTHIFNLAFITWFARSTAVGAWFADKPPFFFCSAAFNRYAAAAAWFVLAAVVAVPRLRAKLADARASLLVLALVPAAFFEMKLLYPWPRLWSQYYLMWAFVVAISYGAVQAALARLLRAFASGRAQWMAAACVSGGAAALAAGAYVSAWVELGRKPMATSYFRDVSWVQRHLRGGDTVWLGPLDAHPIGANDAAYYWFSFADFVPFATEFAASDAAQGRLPRLHANDWPPCRAADGLDRRLRFVSLEAGALAEPCMQRLNAAHRLRATPVPGVVMVED